MRKLFKLQNLVFSLFQKNYLMNKQNTISDFEDFLNVYRNIKLNKEICEFIGALIGDGYIVKKKYTLGITGDQKLDEDYLRNYITRIFKSIFPKTSPRLYYRKDENTLMFIVNSKNVVQFFKEIISFPVGKKSSIIKIPNMILSSDKELVLSTVRGIFDTDGCVFFDKRKIYKKPYPRITLQVDSRPLYEQIKLILQEYFSLYTKEAKHKITGKDKFYIEVYGHHQLKKWIKLIGFSNKRHLDKINASVA